jgi:large subunit ribosomal protein L4
MKMEIKTIDNQNAGYIEVNDNLTNMKFHKEVVWEAVNHYLACQRSGTACTKTRKEVSGGGKKPWKQKHTGRARAGSIRSPLWRHGGTIFGPKPRDFSYAFPKKKRLLAIKSVIANKLKEGDIHIIDSLNLPQPKTKEALKIFKAFNLLSGIHKVLFIDFNDNINCSLAVRNLPKTKFMPLSFLNVYDLMNYKKIFISKAAFEKMQEMIAK